MEFTKSHLILTTAVLLLIAGIVVFASWFRITGQRKCQLPVPVSRLHQVDIGCVFLLILLKHILVALGVNCVFPRETRDARWKGPVRFFPELELKGSLALSSADEKRYDVATDSQLEDRVMLLPALTTPMMLILLANRDCPILPFGSVNTGNRFEFLHPAACRYPGRYLDFGGEGRNGVEVEAFMGGSDRPVRMVAKGLEVDVEVIVNGKLKGGDGKMQMIFKQNITVLKPIVWRRKKETLPSSLEEISWVWNDEANSSVKLDNKAPRKWAALCCDYNPIHMYDSLARMFSFPSKIAHGNHVAASIIQQWDISEAASISEEGLQDALLGEKPCYLHVQFKRPMALPSEMKIRYGRASDKYKVFGLKAERDGKECLILEAGELKS